MESILKKYQLKFKKVKGELGRWEELQSRLISQFSNASAIIQRLQVIQDSSNYGVLNSVEGIEDAILAKQIELLQKILLSMGKTMDEFHAIVSSLEKIARDGHQLVRVGSSQLTAKQLEQRIGLNPSISCCLDGLKQLEEMHRSEYLLKKSIVSSLPVLALKPSGSNSITALQQLLVDQPNIPAEQVTSIFDMRFASEIP